MRHEKGVQKPYEISVVTGLEEAKGIILSVSAYLNPTGIFAAKACAILSFH